MQYGVDIGTYKRINKSNDKKIRGTDINRLVLLKRIALFFVSFFISRAIILNNTAPFGIAFLLVAFMNENSKNSLVCALGSLIGYITIQSYIKDATMYFLLIPLITFITLFINEKLSKSSKKVILGLVVLLSIFIFGKITNKLTFGLSLINAFSNICIIFPIYFILERSILYVKEIQSNHIFTDEEIICMSILLAVVVAGTWGVELFNISLANIMALFIVLVFSYINGGAIGATVGIIMGAIIGMSNQYLLLYVTVLGTCGLIAGIFRESGKILLSLSFLVAFSIFKVYSITSAAMEGGNFIMVEVLIVIVGFLIMPKSFYNTLNSELTSDDKKERINKEYLTNVKNVYLGKLDNFSDVLGNMSNILINLADNDKLLMKNKSIGLVDNLASRVCSECNTACICWNREYHSTYSAFVELIENKQQNVEGFPNELERKCLKKGALIRNAEDIVNKYIINEMWRTRLSEGRELLAGQINTMSKSVRELVEDFTGDIKTDVITEKNIIKILDRHRISYDDVFCIKNKKNRMIIRICTSNYNSLTHYGKSILPLINNVVDIPMIINEEESRINEENNQCIIVVEQAPKFKVSTFVAKASKDGFLVHGDSYSFGKVNMGDYMMILSDGMGSGPEAGRESEAAVELIEKFTKAGLSKSTAINTVNSIMTLKFSEEEKFSTVDLSSIDLYTGKVDFMKVGAVSSFIKFGDTIDIIKSKSLPMGVLEKADIEEYTRNVKPGDLIIMVSDGIIDVESTGKVDWILDYIIRNEKEDLDDLAQGLVEKAKSLSKNKVNDDMTVIVSKIYEA